MLKVLHDEIIICEINVNLLFIVQNKKMHRTFIIIIVNMLSDLLI